MKKYLNFNVLTVICLTLCFTFIYRLPLPANASEILQKSSEKEKSDMPEKDRVGGATRGKCVSTAGQLITFSMICKPNHRAKDIQIHDGLVKRVEIIQDIFT